MAKKTKQQIRLQTKIFLLVSAAVFIISMVTLALIILNSAQQLKEESFNKVREIAYQHSHDIEKELGDTMAIARAYAVSVHSILLMGDINQRLSIMKNTQLYLDFLPARSVVWALFEPGVPAARKKSGGKLYSGNRFTPFAYRQKSGVIAGDIGLWNNKRHTDYYRITKQAKKETVNQVFKGADASILMTSFCVPIIENGEVIGVAGIDVALSDLSNRMGKIRPLDEKSFAYMISNDGTFVAHPWPIYFGYNINDPRFGTPKKTFDAIKQGKEVSEVRTSPLTGQKWYVYIVPVRIGESDAPWSFGITVPLSTVLAKSKNLVWASIINAVLSSIVLLLAVFVIVRTISTPVQKTLSNLNKAVEQASEAVCIIGIDRKVQFVNPAMEKISGSSSGDLIGKEPLLKTREGIQPEDIWRTLDQGNVWTGCITDDISGFSQEVAITPLRNEKSIINGYLWVGRDITRELDMEAQLLQSQKMEAIGILAGGIAHDFNNILTALIGYASLIQAKMDTTHPLRSYVDQILLASHKAADLTKNLLAFSRKQPVNLAALDMNATIRGTERLLKRLLTEDITLETRLTPEDVTVMADKSQMDQILLNLAANARDAMPKGGTLTIGTEITTIGDAFITMHGIAEPGEYIQVTVTDTGIGMDETTRENIFDPFFTTKETGKGTGLGLATVYGIVKQHNGYITVDSRLNQGTTFCIYLPLVRTGVSETEDITVPAAGGKETILVAEDNDEVRNFMREVLQQYGYAIIEARDGDDAVEKFKHHQDINLLILDSVMPKKNGRETYEEIKLIYPHIKVLFTSGYTKDVILDKGIEDEKLDFIAKPLSIHKLLEKVREVLDRR